MPEIEITSEQHERLRALQEEIARDVVGKYGHVRPRDAVEYLLDRYEADESTPTTSSGESEMADGEAVDTASASTADATTADAAADGAAARVVDADNEDGDADDDANDGDAGDGADADGGDDAMLDEMMSLLDTHDDKWGESSGDERYAVELPDGETEQVRTKDDVKALLFKHYR
ncbi:hypothetical protein [Haloplanus sp. C73]|uniref:hypothetical protein n=1 Tax=Haloplanus sp. C73 TaxID=3421641 RepID=UPI003EB8765F